MTGFESRTFHALAHDFRFVSEDVALGAYLGRLFDGFAPGDDDRVATYRIQSLRDPLRYAVHLRDDQIIVAATASELVSSFVHQINVTAIDIDYAVTLHAGGVARDGVVFVFPAHMESGKTTLTAGLVRAGFDYVTDEAVALGWDTGLVEPFPKPLSLDAGSWPLFAELEPQPAPGDDASATGQWQLPVRAFGATARVARPGPVGVVAFPAYQAGSATELVPLSRAEALVELARNTFQFRDRPRDALELLARVVRGCTCFRLPIGDLGAACALVETLAAPVAVAEPTRG